MAAIDIIERERKHEELKEKAILTINFIIEQGASNLFEVSEVLQIALHEAFFEMPAAKIKSDS